LQDRHHMIGERGQLAGQDVGHDRESVGGARVPPSVISWAMPSGVPVKSRPPGSADSFWATVRNVVAGSSAAIV
jgi:hypothetical protein